MKIPNEIWYIIFINLWPIDIVNIRLVCRLFNNIIIDSSFIKIWPNGKYYQDLLGIIESDIYYTYDEYFNRNYNYDNLEDDNDKFDVLFVKIIRYGDIELAKQLLKPINNLHYSDWLLECSVRSNNINVVKLVDDNFIFNFGAWKYALIESIDTNNLEIINYVSINTGYSDRYYGFIQSIITNKFNIANYLFKQGFNHDYINGKLSIIKKYHIDEKVKDFLIKFNN